MIENTWSKLVEVHGCGCALCRQRTLPPEYKSALMSVRKTAWALGELLSEFALLSAQVEFPPGMDASGILDGTAESLEAMAVVYNELLRVARLVDTKSERTQANRN